MLVCKILINKLQKQRALLGETWVLLLVILLLLNAPRLTTSRLLHDEADWNSSVRFLRYNAAQGAVQFRPNVPLPFTPSNVQDVAAQAGWGLERADALAVSKGRSEKHTRLRQGAVQDFIQVLQLFVPS